MKRLVGTILLAFTLVVPALAVQPGEQLADPALEARARAISKELRCLVCQNENIDDSHAALARDLRIIVRERLMAGDTDKQVYDYVTARYGDFVLFRPPVRSYTLALWFGPFAVLLIGGVGAAVYLRSRRHQIAAAGPTQALTPEEEARLAKLVGDRS